MNEQLKIVISAEVEKAKKGCQEATKAIREVGDTAERTGSKADKAFAVLGSSAKKAGAICASALGAGIAAAAGGVVALTKAAVQSYAEYEQLVGGVETLFKDSADQVKQYAENAWKTAGISANKYMETATSFSASLIQSLGGDTAEAAKYADMAITDMSDNANKMGTSMDSLINTYQSLSRGNFAMLDNLKLGYGGTKEEMERLIADAHKLDDSIKLNDMSFGNMVKAIHAVQEEMGITGTTAREASETISGSVGAMKASWENLLVGIADDNADFEGLIDTFVGSVDTALQNILPRVEIALEGIAQLIEKLLPVIAERIPEILANTLPTIIMAGVNIVVALIEGLSTAMPTLIQALVDIIPQAIQSLLAVLPQLLVVGVQALVQIINGITQMLPDLLTAVSEIIPEIVKALTENADLLIEAAVVLIITLAEAVIENLPLIISAAIEIIGAIVSALIDGIPQLLGAGVDLIAGLVSGMINSIPKIIQAAGKLVGEIKKNLVEKAKGLMKFDWSLPKLKLPTIQIKGKFSLSPLQVPKFSINWNALGGVFDKPTLFGYGGSLQGIGEDGAEAVVPLEKNTEWMNVLANKLSERMGGSSTPIILQVDGKTFAQTTIKSINDLTRQTGTLALNLR